LATVSEQRTLPEPEPEPPEPQQVALPQLQAWPLAQPPEPPPKGLEQQGPPFRQREPRPPEPALAPRAQPSRQRELALLLEPERPLQRQEQALRPPPSMAQARPLRVPAPVRALEPELLEQAPQGAQALEPWTWLALLLASNLPVVCSGSKVR
jgi:hypothetical protein